MPEIFNLPQGILKVLPDFFINMEGAISESVTVKFANIKANNSIVQTATVVQS